MIVLFVGVLNLILFCGIKCDDVIPYDGMKITRSMIFKKGVYYLPNGISIISNDVKVEMNGATLIGSDSSTKPPSYGLTISKVSNVSIQNGNIHGYYYGIISTFSNTIAIKNMNCSKNYLDPESITSSPPSLIINTPVESLGDRHQLGGGIFFHNVTRSEVSKSFFNNQENGIDIYSSFDNLIIDNQMSFNTGWGIHLHSSSRNKIVRNFCVNNIRKGLLDSAAILLVYKSNYNEIIENTMDNSGDGFFIGNELGCPSNFNLIRSNAARNCPANAYETTFSNGNIFYENLATHSGFGFWLGYSHNTTLFGNLAANNSFSGVQIDHGQNYIFEDNTFERNGQNGAFFYTDGKNHFPEEKYPCLDLPVPQNYSKGYILKGNIMRYNGMNQLQMVQTTDSVIYNNYFGKEKDNQETIVSDGIRNTWSLKPKEKGRNVIKGEYIAGNFYSDYKGKDLDHDGIGDTLIPYNNDGKIKNGGDDQPLVYN